MLWWLEEGWTCRETLDVDTAECRRWHYPPQGTVSIKVPSGQFLAFMCICVILLEFGKDRPQGTRSILYLSGVSASESLQRRASGSTSQTIQPAGCSAC